jgi:hypothetical protein
MALVKPCLTQSASQLKIVDVFADIVNSMKPGLDKLGLSTIYTYGKGIQILTYLQGLDNSITHKQKYPLIALFMPFKEQMGGDYYTTAKFSKIVIASLSNATDRPEERYQKSFNTILYPVYQEFLKQISRNPNVVLHNQDYIPHTKMDNPGSPPPKKDSAGFSDYVDAIEIYDMELTFQLNSNYKTI